MSPSARKRLIIIFVFVLCAVIAAVKFGSVTSLNIQTPTLAKTQGEPMEIPVWRSIKAAIPGITAQEKRNDSDETLTTSIETPGSGPHIYLGESNKLPVTYLGDTSAIESLTGGDARPLSMTSGDFDGDGVDDLLVGYSTSQGGIIALHRGNLDAFAPQSKESF